MKIAQVAPLIESVPPKAYGGTERVVSYLTEALVGMGHQVTLYASGDSVTQARLVPVVGRGLRLDPRRPDWLAWYTLMLEQVFESASRYDVVHFHIDYLHFPLARRCRTPCVTTLHGRQDLPDLEPLYRHFNEQPVVSISDSQREPLPVANWCGTACRSICTLSTPSRRTTSPSSAACRPKSVSTGRSRSRSPAACRCASRPRSTPPTAPISTAS
jgi:hypothetical protein